MTETEKRGRVISTVRKTWAAVVADGCRQNRQFSLFCSSRKG
jgi:hypothetical protein